VTTTAPKTGTILDTILDTKQEEVAALRSRQKMADLIAACADLPPTRGFKASLTPNPSPKPGKGELDNNSPLSQAWERGAGGVRANIALIAEVKKASPSKGIIREDFDPVAIARAYQQGGVSCLSVLTDERYFQGSLTYLAAIREAVPMPLLRKDFLIDTAQVYEARLAGADAILLIVAAIPSPARLAEMRHVAESLGMDALVEVHDASELDAAAESGATLIGVNNRDLRTFEVRLETFEALRPSFPAGAVAVAESGIHTREDARRLHAAGADALLVGESLMRAADIASATRTLLGL
jgi:indole-3-glycerol phosphate synthase